MLRAQTTDGPVYLKVALDTPLFANESLVVAELDALFPGTVPKPVAVDRDRRFLALRDAGPVVGWQAPIDSREEFVRAAAQLHIRSVPHIDRLLAAGCLDRRLDWLADQSTGWLARVDLSRWLSADEIAVRPGPAARRLPGRMDRVRIRRQTASRLAARAAIDRPQPRDQLRITVVRPRSPGC